MSSPSSQSAPSHYRLIWDCTGKQKAPWKPRKGPVLIRFLLLWKDIVTMATLIMKIFNWRDSLQLHGREHGSTQADMMLALRVLAASCLRGSRSSWLPVTLWKAWAKVKMQTKTKSHTSSELSTVKGCLFRSRLTDHSPLLEWENSNPVQQLEERVGTLYIDIYSIRGHTQVGW